MKVAVTISLDQDVIKELRERGVNISGTINYLLRDFLTPKKADFKKENLTLNIIEFGKTLNLTPDMAVFTHENLALDATALWKNFKELHNPKFNLYDYIEIRKKFREKFLKE